VYMKQFVLIGNYGVGNMGDEALKHYFLRTFPEVQWSVLSAHPVVGELHRLPCGMRSLFGTPWWKTFRCMRRCDGVVFGGGSLFTDTESVQACILWWWHAFVARLHRKPVHLAFQGIGPFRTRLGRLCATSVIRRAASLSVRDRFSLARVQFLCPGKEVTLAFDPVYGDTIGSDRVAKEERVLMIIPRKNSSGAFWHLAEETVRRESWDTIEVICLQQETNLPVTCDAVHQVQSWNELLDQLKCASFVVSERFHGALAALVLGVPFTVSPQCPEDKFDALEKEQCEGRESFVVRIRQGEEELRRGLRLG